MADCLFCKMIKGEIKAKVAHEDERMFVIHDINPQAPVHLLIIPKKHVEKLAELKDGDQALMGEAVLRAKILAEENGWGDYRLVVNNGAQAGQSVFHIHFHLLSGRRMTWPPG